MLLWVVGQIQFLAAVGLRSRFLPGCPGVHPRPLPRGPSICKPTTASHVREPRSSVSDPNPQTQL